VHHHALKRPPLHLLLLAARAGQQAEAVQLAQVQLEATNATVSELRDKLANLSSDFKGQLASKGTELDELQASCSRLRGQLADAQALKQQAEGHAGEQQREACGCGMLPQCSASACSNLKRGKYVICV
jgi:Tfp pilus assembly protein PilV